MSELTFIKNKKIKKKSELTMVEMVLLFASKKEMVLIETV